MGYYTEYLNQNLDFAGLGTERKRQLRKISELRKGRDVLVFAADLNKPQGPLVSINYSDLLPIKDQLAGLSGNAIDFILETPGGSGEVAEDIVRLLRERYKEVAIIIPGYAKSAGTIMAMSADEILMSSSISALGPIDAQLFWQGKIFSADAFREGLNRIKKEVEETGSLNKAYIPILQGISPGEIQNAQNALDFAKTLVTRWLAEYKFKTWTKHAKSGNPVTQEEKEIRAKEIAEKLCNHQYWLTHGRSIKMNDLESMKLKIIDYSADVPLAEAIDRYYTLLQMSFASPLYKIFETADTQILRSLAPLVSGTPEGLARDANIATIEVMCQNCSKSIKVQANLGKTSPTQGGCVAFPADGKLKCLQCGIEQDLARLKKQIEKQTGKKIVS